MFVAKTNSTGLRLIVSLKHCSRKLMMQPAEQVMSMSTMKQNKPGCDLCHTYISFCGKMSVLLFEQKYMSFSGHADISPLIL